MQIKNVGYVGSGFSIDFLMQIKPQIEKLIVSQKNQYLQLTPKLIFEVKFQAIQKSKLYSSGWALRFPSFKTIRYDKKITQATTLTQLREINEIHNE